ncbi:clumping factor B-like, partial [Leptopilina boulardi]|uniref:clumping factor B-like n=1 Tax=Leptopilina boulardi TaxID=63433 RepID=UPI0021F6399E
MALHAHNSLSQLEVQKNDVSPESTEILILKQALKEAEERARILQLELKKADKTPASEISENNGQMDDSDNDLGNDKLPSTAGSSNINSESDDSESDLEIDKPLPDAKTSNTNNNQTDDSDSDMQTDNLPPDAGASNINNNQTDDSDSDLEVSRTSSTGNIFNNEEQTDDSVSDLEVDNNRPFGVEKETTKRENSNSNYRQTQKKRKYSKYHENVCRKAFKMNLERQNEP